jgi:hypothetical protein
MKNLVRYNFEDFNLSFIDFNDEFLFYEENNLYKYIPLNRFWYFPIYQSL